MRRLLSFRYIAVFCLILLGLVFYIYNFIPHKAESQYAFRPSGIFPSDTDEGSSDNNASGNDLEGNNSTGNDNDGNDNSASDNSKEQETATKDLMIKVRGTTLSLGESTEAIIGKLGTPGRIDETEYDFDFYIYNNDYTRLIFIAIADGKAVGFYTDSLDFNYKGIKSGSTIDTINTVLKQDYSLSDIITYKDKEKNYSVQIFIDTLDTHLVTGVYILSNSVKIDEYSEKAMRGIELMVYDLTNSIRVRNNKEVLSWSSSAAKASRKHSRDMADNNFFSHKNLKREDPADRLRAEGIFVTTSSENLIAGYDTVFESVHKLYNSKAQKINMLNKHIRFIGVGFAYNPDSKYSSYITQSLYR